MKCEFIFRSCQIIQISLSMTVSELTLPPFDLCDSESTHVTIGFYVLRTKLNSD